MTSPTPTPGKFATEDDVTGRFEGTFPSGRLAWVNIRIGDVERELMRQVKSLRKPLADIIEESNAIGDPDRVDRVRALVADKVLALHRNPSGSKVRFQAMDGVSESQTFADDNRARTGVAVSFTEAELSSVRLPRQKRSKLRTLGVAPAGELPC